MSQIFFWIFVILDFTRCHLLYLTIGGSRISPGWGFQPCIGRQHTILPNFPKKGIILKEYWTQRVASKIFLYRSATDYLASLPLSVQDPLPCFIASISAGSLTLLHCLYQFRIPFLASLPLSVQDPLPCFIASVSAGSLTLLHCLYQCRIPYLASLPLSVQDPLPCFITSISAGSLTLLHYLYQCRIPYLASLPLSVKDPLPCFTASISLGSLTLLHCLYQFRIQGFIFILFLSIRNIQISCLSKTDTDF